MQKRPYVIILVIAVLVGICACSVQGSETSRIKSNLEQIREGVSRFSELENGTLKVENSLITKNNAPESMNFANENNTSIITFVLNQGDYDLIEEISFLNEKTKEIQCSATKQVQGIFFYALPIKPLEKERAKPYEWMSNSEPGQKFYEPNGALKMMAVPAKLLEDEKYIKAIAKEKNGSLTKYTLTMNDPYARYMKEGAHSVEESYIVHEQSEIFWINEGGLLIKRQSFGEFEWTIDGVADIYTFDMTIELTGYNYLKLTEIGDELSPMIMFKGEMYTQSQALLDINLDALIEIGKIESIVGSVQEPEQDNQANRFIQNAIIYGSGENGIIVKYTHYMLYEKSH